MGGAELHDRNSGKQRRERTSRKATALESEGDTVPVRVKCRAIRELASGRVGAPFIVSRYLVKGVQRVLGGSCAAVEGSRDIGRFIPKYARICVPQVRSRREMKAEELVAG